MSSATSFYTPPAATTVWTPVRSPSYYDSSVGDTVLVPFIVNNGVLDINIQDNVTNNLLQNPSNLIESGYTNRVVRQMGGLSLVSSLGPTLQTFLEDYILNYEGGTIGNVKLYIAPTMTRVQQNVGPSSDSALDGQEAIVFFASDPTNDQYQQAGSQSDNYFSCWVFKTPMAISYTYNGQTRYVTFRTDFSNPS